MLEKSDVIFTSHAHYQLQERGLNEKEIIAVLQNPDKTIKQTNGRHRALKITTRKRKECLWVVVYEKHNSIIEVITVFLTSKIKKYLSL